MSKNIAPKASSDDFYPGTGNRTEKGDVSDAAPIADQDTRQVPRWDPSADYTSKDALLVKGDQASITRAQGDFCYPSAPNVLQKRAPVAFVESDTLHIAGFTPPKGDPTK